MKHPRLGTFGVAFGAAAMSLLFATAAFAGPVYKVLHAFGSGEDGAGVWDSLVFDSKGSLYGTTSGGGAYGYGTVFRLTPGSNGHWNEELLYSFHDPYTTNDGGIPFGGVILDLAGNLYGTTSAGGGSYKIGIIFELTPQSDGRWTESILHRFVRGSSVGAPYAGLAMDQTGNLYGVGGSAFELSRSSGQWKLTVLHKFCSWTNCEDGDGPFAGLILDGAGNLYGTTEGGGFHTYGTAYKVRHTSSGWTEQVLHSFPAFPRDGHTPGVGALLMDATGSLYGTTAGGGCCGGVVFKLTPQTDGHWKETILYDLKGGANGFEAGAGVVMDKADNLYGTTIAGGDPNCDCGVVYKLSPGANGKWTYTVLHTFTGNDGAQPDANLILDNQGNLYGTTAIGGANGGGVVFEITP